MTLFELTGMKTSEVLEKVYPKFRRHDLANIDLLTRPRRCGEDRVDLFYVPLARYIEALDVLAFAEKAIKDQEAEIESLKQSSQPH